MAQQRSLYEQKARDIIIEGMMMRMPGSFDTAQADEVKCVPGSVYAFHYNAEKKTSLKSATGRMMNFSDGLPVVLVTEVSGDNITGFNLNLLRSEFKCLLINCIFNINGRMEDNESLDDRMRRAVMKMGEPAFLNAVLATGIARDPEYRKAAVDILLKSIRKYSQKNMLTVRLIEPGQWKYLPFLSCQAYEGIQRDLYSSDRRS